MRGVVGSVVAHLLLLDCLERPCMVGRLLRPGAIFQLSALHGDHLSRLPPRRRLPEIPNLHGAYHGPDCTDAGAGALLGPNFALDLYHLFDLEPLALQRPELWLVYDVRAPRGREAE